MNNIFTITCFRKVFYFFLFSSFVLNANAQLTAACYDLDTQLAIKVNLNNKKGYKIAAITNLLNGVDTSLGSVRIFSWTSNGSPYFGRTLMQFDLKSIPTNAYINSAKLYLYAKTTGTGEGVVGQPTYGSKNTSLVQKIISTWQTSTLSFNNAPTIDTVGQKILNQSVNTAENYVIDLTDFTQKWVNMPDSNFGVLLRMQTENNPYNSMLFECGAASDSNKNVRLEICYFAPLPISLFAFDANVNNDLVNLNWIISDAKNAISIVEKSTDGINFSVAGSLKGMVVNNTSKYSFVDKTTIFTIEYYRIKVMSAAGFYEYSKTIKVIPNTINSIFSNTLIYPNPISNSDLNIRLNLIKDQLLNIGVYDMKGKQVYFKKVFKQKGVNSFSIPCFNDLSAGLYTLNIVSDTELITKKVLKQ